MTARMDPSLGSVAQAAPPGLLEPAGPALARAGAAGPGPFLLEGERMAVTGGERRGGHAFWVGPRCVAAELDARAGAGVNVVAAPSSLRRELLGEHGSLLEVTLAAPTLPLAAVQWQAPPGGRWGGSLELGFVLLPGCAELRHLVHGESVRCLAEGGAEAAAVEVRVHPAPAAWHVAEEAGGGLRVRASLSAEGPVTFAVSGGSAQAAGRAMAAVPHLAAHETRADAASAQPEWLAAATGMPDVDQGVLWARSRVRYGLLRCADGPAEQAFWAGMGAAAAGDADAALRGVDALRRFGPEPVPWRLGPPVPASSLATLLGARVTLQSGDPVPALDALHRLRAREARALAAAPEPQARTLWALALHTLADALRWAAPEPETRALREASREAAGGAMGLRLPMAGQLLQGDGADTLGRLLAAEGAPPALRAPETFLGSWALWRARDPDAAWASWRPLVGRGLTGGPGGRGTWDAPAFPPRAAPEAGMLLCAFAHGLLGLAPDAPSGRIRVAPCFPAHVAAFRVGGIRVGQASLELAYEREGRLHRLRVAPTGGRVPVTAVLEPSFPGAGMEAARVDGLPAELEAATRAGRTRVRVQLVLDAPRVLEVEAREAPQPGD